jgi:signal transduction histidine kinase/CheY-like chemotaxis protein
VVLARDGRLTIVAVGLTTAFISLLALAGGTYALLFDNLQEIVAAGGGALGLALAGRRAGGPGYLNRAMAVALGSACLGMIAWDLSHELGSGLAMAGDLIFVAGTSTGAVAVVRAVFGGIPRDRLIGVAIDTIIVLLAGMAIVAALWRASVVAPGGLTASVGAVVLISASAGCSFGLLVRRVGLSTPGPWLVLTGAITVGASWLLWIGNPTAPSMVDLSDFMFSAGLLVLAYGAVTWDVRSSQGSAFERVALVFNSLLPVAAIVGSLGLLALTRGADFLDLLGLATSAVIVAAAVRQLHLYSRESRARSALSTRTDELQAALAALELEVAERQRLEAEREAMKERLIQNQRLESIGRLAGGVAHDFNNLLTAIRGSAELAALRLSGDEEGREDVEAIVHASDQAAALTGQLLAFSRNQQLRPSVVDLNRIVAGTEPLLRRLLGERIELVVHQARDPWPVLVDPSQFESVIVNLAVNARDAMANGGRMTIETSNVELDEEYGQAHPEVEAGQYAMVAVADTGKGMNASTLALIFEPFFTTKRPGKGTGLGLATVYGTVRQSGGHVAVESAPGRGTTFRIYVPRTQATEEAAASSVPAAGRPPVQATILVAEDESSVRAIVTTALRRKGYTVVAVSSGEEALDVIARGGLEIGVLLTDVVMPGISGIELIKRACQLNPGLRAVCMSGYMPETLEFGRDTPNVRLLAKPFTIASLEQTIREALGD